MYRRLISIFLIGLGCLAACPEQIRAADHFLAPTTVAVPLLRYFAAEQAKAQSVANRMKADDAGCAAGHACVVCLANCSAGSVIVQQVPHVAPEPRGLLLH
jgi:hypothetical protein